MIFVRIPKTGTKYVKECLKRSRLYSEELLGRGPIFSQRTIHSTCTARQINTKDYFIFTSIRHPVAWYKSCYFAFKNVQWENSSGIFNEFVREYVKGSFGQYVRNLQKYKKKYGQTPLLRSFQPFLNEADFVCRLENINSDLKKIIPGFQPAGRQVGNNPPSLEYAVKQEHVEIIEELDKEFIRSYYVKTK